MSDIIAVFVSQFEKWFVKNDFMLYGCANVRITFYIVIVVFNSLFYVVLGNIMKPGKCFLLILILIQVLVESATALFEYDYYSFVR